MWVFAHRLALPVAMLLFIASMCLLLPLEVRGQDIQTDTTISAPRLAPGESLPVRVKLSNFGSNARTDVTVKYEIISASGAKIASESETVAVETTATYIHDMTVPVDVPPGLYSVRTSVLYVGQKVPAVGSYQFKVERKFAGIFVSDLMVYGGIATGGLAISFAVLWLFRRSRAISLAPHDYSKIPHSSRIYYEIIEDVIREMRFHEGDGALTVAAHADGLTINSDTGEVMRIAGDPAAVVASLVSAYEKRFGKRVNLAFGNKRENRAIVR